MFIITHVKIQDIRGPWERFNAHAVEQGCSTQLIIVGHIIFAPIMYKGQIKFIKGQIQFCKGPNFIKEINFETIQRKIIVKLINLVF